jgi:hypothetical protein
LPVQLAAGHTTLNHRSRKAHIDQSIPMNNTMLSLGDSPGSSIGGNPHAPSMPNRSLAY